MTVRRRIVLVFLLVVLATAAWRVLCPLSADDAREFPFKCRQCGHEVTDMPEAVYTVRDCPECSAAGAFCPAVVCRECGQIFAAWPRREGLAVKCTYCGVKQGP